MTTIKYEIREGRYAQCELWSVATGLKFGRKAENFVCEGTRSYCELVKKKLEAMK